MLVITRREGEEVVIGDPASPLGIVRVAVIKGEDVDAVTSSLLEADVRLTRINTTGGFLRRGNSTLLIGVPANEVDEVMRLIRAACPAEADASPVAKGLPMYSATVFVLDSSHFERV